MTAHSLLHILPTRMTTGISLAARGKTPILKTLQETGDNRTRASGINRRTRQNKLEEYDIQ